MLWRTPSVFTVTVNIALDFARRLRAAFAGRNIQVSAETEE
jgi:hypothetical protein